MGIGKKITRVGYCVRKLSEGFGEKVVFNMNVKAACYASAGLWLADMVTTWVAPICCNADQFQQINDNIIVDKGEHRACKRLVNTTLFYSQTNVSNCDSPDIKCDIN